MSCNAIKDLLKNAITDMRKDGKIDTTVETSVSTFIDDITLTDFLEVEYSSFDQTNSVNITFDDTARTAQTAVGSELITLALGLNDIKVKGLKLKAANEDVSWLLSKDGTNFFSVNSYSLDESISSSEDLFVKITTDEIIDIKLRKERFSYF